jgi:hypothetical protein
VPREVLDNHNHNHLFSPIAIFVDNTFNRIRDFTILCYSEELRVASRENSNYSTLRKGLVWEIVGFLQRIGQLNRRYNIVFFHSGPIYVLVSGRGI